MKSFPDLRVGQLSMYLVETVYTLTRKFPKEEGYGLTSQVRRAVVSIPSNIAEGHTREHIKEYLHHLSMAQPSLVEVETQVEIATRLTYLLPSEFEDLVRDIRSLGKQLYGLRNALRRSQTNNDGSN